jgi:CheY-like chemotaxis protein
VIKMDTCAVEFSPHPGAGMQTRSMLSFETRRKLPTLLLIDDDLVSREVTATVLTMSGYTVHTATGGALALEMLAAQECAPDVILMDAQMPGISGTELIAALRTRTKARIYAVSGSQPPDDVTAAADGFLLKPFDAETLEKMLEGHPLPGAPVRTSRLNLKDPVISTDTLAQFRGMMPEAAVREIYTAVVADLFKRMQAIEAAIARGDDNEVRRLGHAIKGGCGMAGAIQAARLGALFEEIPPDTESNHLDNSMALLSDLRAAVRNLERMLEAELPA